MVPNKILNILVDLNIHGVSEAAYVSDLAYLLGKGWVKQTHLAGRKLVYLSERGKDELGLPSAKVRLSADALHDQLIHRSVSRIMTTEGYHFCTYAARTLAWYERKEGGGEVLCAAKNNGYRARSVKRLLEKYSGELIFRGARLDIWSPEPHNLVKTVAGLDFVTIRTLNERPR